MMESLKQKSPSAELYLLNAIFIKLIKYLPELFSIHVAHICILLCLLKS